MHGSSPDDGDTATAPTLPKAPTGITGLDEVTGGGLPRGRTTLVAGSAGAGKTLFGIEFLVRGARDFGEPGVLLSFEESRDELAQNVSSLGFDVGGDGARTMMLVYNMPSVNALYRRFPGIDGSAYLIGGFGVTAVGAEDMVVVPIRSGLGWRLGVNLGYLKFTPEPTWNPF